LEALAISIILGLKGLKQTDLSSWNISNKIDDVLYALSNLKANEFISEEKKDEEIKKYGLDSP